MASRKTYLARNIEDVDVTGVDNNDSLVWDSGDEKWKPVAISGGGGGDVSDFTDLDDTPASYAGEGETFVKVNIGEDALEFATVIIPNDFTDLDDTPANYTSASGKYVKVNDGETALEFDTVVAGVGAFLDLTDTPSVFTAASGLAVLVNNAEDALIFTKVPATIVDYKDGETVYAILDDTINPGVLDAIAVSDDGGLDISWGEGEIYTTNRDIVETDAGSDTCTDNLENYLVWTSGTGLELTTTDPTREQIGIAHFSCQDGDIWYMYVEPIISTLTHDIQHGMEELVPVAVARGCVVAEDADGTNDLDVEVSAGEYYLDAHKEVEVPNIKSRTTDMRRWFHSSGAWTSEAAEEIDTANYDDGDDKADLGTNKWVRSVFFVSETQIHWVYPSTFYSVQAQALIAPDPLLPPGLVDFPKSTALVYQADATDFSGATWIDVRPVLGIQGSGSEVSDHGSLSGLADDDHAQYLLVDGTRAMTGTFDLGDQDLANQGAGHDGFTDVDADNHHNEVHDLDSHSDVQAEAPADSQVLTFVTASGKWLPQDAGGGGASAFTDLTDVPASYSGEGEKYVRVASSEDALEFVAASANEISASKVTIVTNESAAQDAHTATDTWEYITAASGYVVLDEAGDLEMLFNSMIKSDSANWEHYWIRFQVDTPTETWYTPIMKSQLNVNANTSHYSVKTYAYTFSGVASGGYTVRAQWNDGTSGLDASFYDRQISVKGTWDVTGGVRSTFLGLSDVPSSYAGQAGKVPVVNVDETALEFLPTVASGILQGYARAKATVGQTITTVATIFDWDSVTTDPDSTITAGAAWKWTAPYDCYVIISTSIGMQGAEEMVGEFLVNDAIVETFQKSNSGGTWNTANAEFIYKADADDYINVTIKRGTGSNRATALNWSHIGIYYIRDLTSLLAF